MIIEEGGRRAATNAARRAQARDLQRVSRVRIACISATGHNGRNQEEDTMSHAVNWFQIQGPNGHALQQFYKQVSVGR